MNLNPEIKEKNLERFKLDLKDNVLLDVNKHAIYELIRDIKDPEHPLSLESLDVVDLELIQILEVENNIQGRNIGKKIKQIVVEFVPTIPHCSMASVIGLSIKYQLLKYIKGYWIVVNIKKDTHSNYNQLNKQLNDKDRVNAALENDTLIEMLESSIPKLL
ncbi:hypothetical protein SLOPH_1651 [Spraguea lophii 42_110]|uniref:Uncharacterized protein n=1 Tax=Spraguea lophii (strain 42_110) TaxID=1358809 RepID=S7XTC5_SPRLO|nr:hypothetical protein SLOPH_1651 [Spraguea lophii 42_110]